MTISKFFVIGVLAGVSLRLAAQTNVPDGVLPAAGREFEEKAHYDRAFQHLAQQQWGMAVWDFSEVIRIDPNNAPAFEGRAYAQIMRKEIDKGIADYSEVVRLQPENASAHLNRGNAYREKMEFDKAIEDFTACARLNPTNAFAYKLRAACYSAKWEWKKEIEDLNEGLRLDPNDAFGWTARATAYELLRQFENAVADYRKAISVSPDYRPAYNNLAWMLATCPDAKIRNGKEAVELATKTCELWNWTDSASIDTLAAAYAEKADFDQAVKYQKQAMGMADVTEEDRKGMQSRLALYEKHKTYQETRKPTKPPGLK